MSIGAQAAWIAAALFLIYWEPVLGYLRDQHYQEHFVYLWSFLAIALWRSLRGPFRAAVGWTGWRDRLGLACALLASALLLGSSVAGSSTGLRTSLVGFLTGLAIVAVPRWTVVRCLMHGLLLLLCFGLPYSVYFPITSQLQWGVVWLVELPARLGLANYQVVSNVVVFPHYQLVITADCSGVGQLLTFLGIAALGVLSSAPNRLRTVLVVVLAVGLAWLSNLARVSLFVFLVSVGWTRAIDSDAWHAAIGFLVFMPFVMVLVGVILKTHRSPVWDLPVVTLPGRMRVAWLVAPLLAVHLLLGRGEQTEFPQPAYFAALDAPPGHVLDVRAPSETAERQAYGTRWLLNARFARADGACFDLFHYATRSRSHLCVHKIPACIGIPGQSVRYEPPVEIEGRLWWRIALEGNSAEDARSVYFAFEVGGERRDDSVATQLEVFRQRIFGGSWEVRLTRVVFFGSLPAVPGAYETEVLGWLGRQTAAAR